jgi:acylglycerol lipase
MHILIRFQGGYHELQNEPDGVKEKLADTVIRYIEEQLSSINAASEDATPVPTSEAAAEGSTPKANL